MLGGPLKDVITQAIDIAKDALIKPFEGYAKKLSDGSCKAYPDPGTGGHPWTIGYGSTGPSVNKDTVWTLEQADQALEEHILYFCTGVLQQCPNLINYPYKLASIISFAYNVGLGNLRISTLKKRILSEDWVGAQEEIVKWNKANGRVLNGLTKRRQAEAILLGK